MSSTEVRSGDAGGGASVAEADRKLETVTVPIFEVDGAKELPA